MLQLPDTTNCYRLCHAEGDGLSGLISEEEFLGMISCAGKNARREMRLFRVAGAGADPPVSNRYPEGRYLKAAFHQVL